jgi:hypothetical protein
MSANWPERYSAGRVDPDGASTPDRAPFFDSALAVLAGNITGKVDDEPDALIQCRNIPLAHLIPL